jgi:hypothetical protein
MRKALLLAMLATSVLAVCGCAGEPTVPRSEADARLFAPVSMRVHPIFTQVKDWNGDGKPDGIEALVELQDQFGDPTKAAGRIIFELYDFKPYDPERRGDRVVNPWIGYLETLDEQRDRWNRTSRTYGFQLAYPDIQPAKSYVLTAEFQLSNGSRFFDRTILEGNKNASDRASVPATSPIPASTEPAARPPEP